MEWLRQQGPWCPALIEYLEKHHASYDALIFFTYLYAPTVLGLKVAPSQEHPGPDRARRAGHPPLDLPARSSRCRRPSATTPRPSAGSSRRASRSRAAREETVGCGVDLPQHHAYPRQGPPAPRRDRGRGASRRPRAGDRHRFRSHLDLARRDVPPAAPPARAVRPVRRADREGQGLRGTDRVLQHLRRRGRRRDARADGRQADAAARGAVRQVRRAALRHRARPGARGGHRRRRSRLRSRACRCWRSRRSRSARRSSPTPAARCSWTTA